VHAALHSAATSVAYRHSWINAGALYHELATPRGQRRPMRRAGTAAARTEEAPPALPRPCRLHVIMSGQDRHSHQTVMLKTFQKSRLSSTAHAKLEAELETLKLLSGSPGIVKFVNYVEDDDNCYIVMERCPGACVQQQQQQKARVCSAC
jgi:serine/threonine protein kinase